MKTETRYPRLRNLLVADSMHEGVFACEREAPLSEVAATMARGARPLCRGRQRQRRRSSSLGHRLDLDLVAAALVRDLDDQSAGGSAGTPVVMVTPDETLERAAQLMTEHNTTHLIVIDPARQRPLGVLSTLDIAASL